MTSQDSVVCVFEFPDRAEAAVRELRDDGYDMTKVSILGQDAATEDHVVGYYTTGDRMMYWGGLGTFWGGVWGLLSGSAVSRVPGVGSLLVAGPLVLGIVGSLDKAAGARALGAALLGMGIPETSVVKYEAALKAGKVLLVAHGTADESKRARYLLSRVRAESTTLHAEQAAVAV